MKWWLMWTAATMRRKNVLLLEQLSFCPVNPLFLTLFSPVDPPIRCICRRNGLLLCESKYSTVIFYEDEEYHFFGSDDDGELVDMRNVAGEIKGAERAIRDIITSPAENVY